MLSHLIKPQDTLESMDLVVSSLFVEQLRFALPVKPARVERPVGVADESVTGWTVWGH